MGAVCGSLLVQKSWQGFVVNPRLCLQGVNRLNLRSQTQSAGEHWRLVGAMCHSWINAVQSSMCKLSSGAHNLPLLHIISSFPWQLLGSDWEGESSYWAVNGGKIAPIISRRRESAASLGFPRLPGRHPLDAWSSLIGTIFFFFKEGLSAVDLSEERHCAEELFTVSSYCQVDILIWWSKITRCHFCLHGWISR